MKWYCLTEKERRVLRAPVEIDGFGMLVLTLFDRWDRNAVFVLVTAYVDESGTGGQPRVMLGALVARAHRWHAFNYQWKKLLKREKIPFSHIVAMENKEPPFEEWGRKRTGPFVSRVRPLLKRYLDFGLTVAVSVDDHREHYIAKLSKRARKESCYGLCARSVIEHVVPEAVVAFGPDTIVNFIFEDSSQFESARCAFRDLKDHVPLLAPHLGRIAPGEKTELAGLQAADLVASLGRRAEPKAVFTVVPQHGTSRVPRTHGRLPMFHVDMHEDRLLAYCLQADAIGGEKRFAKAKAKKAKKDAA